MTFPTPAGIVRRRRLSPWVKPALIKVKVLICRTQGARQPGRCKGLPPPGEPQRAPRTGPSVAVVRRWRLSVDASPGPGQQRRRTLLLPLVDAIALHCSLCRARVPPSTNAPAGSRRASAILSPRESETAFQVRYCAKRAWDVIRRDTWTRLDYVRGQPSSLAPHITFGGAPAFAYCH